MSSDGNPVKGISLDLSWINTAIKEHGPWFFIVIGMSIAAYNIASWFSPRLDKVVDSHVKTLDILGESSKEMTASVKEISGAVSEIRDLAESTHALTKEVHNKIDAESKKP